MATDLIDISVPVSATSVVWPGAPHPVLTRRLSLEQGDPVNDSNLFMNVHTGTHIDAPLHHFGTGAAADAVSLEALVGEAWVAEVPEADALTAAVLERVWPAGGTARLLLKTSNSRLWTERAAFTEAYAALTEDAARWLLGRQVRLVGIDYLSVQRFGDTPAVHQVLLGAGVVLVEGLNLSAAAPGRYELLCLPLKLPEADGAPARAVLRRPGGR